MPDTPENIPSSVTMQLAARLDDASSSILGKPDDEARQALTQLEAQLPPEFSEGLREASATASQITERLIEDGGRVIPVPGWVRLGAFAALSAWIQGEANTCTHAGNASRPEPVIAAAWRPDMVVCMNCAHLLLEDSPESDFRCDGCGHVCAPDAANDPIHSVAMQLGALTFWAGSCTGCQALGETEPAS